MIRSIEKMKRKIKPIASLLCLFIVSSVCLLQAYASEEEEYPMRLDTVNGTNMEAFTIERPDPEALKNQMVNAAAFGLSEQKADNYKAFSDALAYCRSHPNTYLVIDKGVYYFKTNASLALKGLKNVLIEGNGAEFIFETQKQFVLDGCDGVEIRDLIIDWNWAKDRIASLVQVQNKTNHSFEIKFLELDEVDADIPLVSFQQYDRRDHVPGAYGEWKTFTPVQVPDSIVGVEKLEPNVLKIEFSPSFTTYFHNDEVYILRHYTYGGAVFDTYGGSRNITFDNVKIYGSAGMGFVFSDKTNHFQVVNSYIGLRPGHEEQQRMSTTADGIHIVNTNGFFRIDHCDFSYTGDDIINVHDDMLKITQFYSRKQLIGNVAGAFVQKGDKIRIYDRNMEDVGFETEVVEITRKEGTATLTLTEALPEAVKEGFFIYRSSNNTHNYVISNNYIHETKGRGTLLFGPDGLFENNVLYRTVGEAVQVRIDINEKNGAIWYDGPGANNITIKNNTFKECAFGGKDSLITIDCNLGDSQGVLSNVRIENNDFLYCYGAKKLISADNVSGLYIENNRISDCNDIAISGHCSAVHMQGNDVTHPSETCTHTDTKIVNDISVGCFEYGSTGKVYCNICHTIINDKIRGIPPLNHKDSLVKRIDVKPTCTESGLSSIVCSLCKTVVETGIIEPPTGLPCTDDDCQGALPFTDVVAGTWQYNTARFVYEHKLMLGTSATTFGPNQDMTRAQFMVILWHMAGNPKVPFEKPFTDVSKSYFAATAIQWAKNMGLASGYSNGSFKPKSPMSREQFCAFMQRYAKYLGQDATPRETTYTECSDADKVSKTFRGAVQWAYERGFIAANGKLNPGDNITRIQAAAVLQRFMNFYQLL